MHSTVKAMCLVTVKMEPMLLLVSILGQRKRREAVRVVPVVILLEEEEVVVALNQKSVQTSHQTTHIPVCSRLVGLSARNPGSRDFA